MKIGAPFWGCFTVWQEQVQPWNRARTCQETPHLSFQAEPTASPFGVTYLTPSYVPHPLVSPVDMRQLVTESYQREPVRAPPGLGEILLPSQMNAANGEAAWEGSRRSSHSEASLGLEYFPYPKNLGCRIQIPHNVLTSYPFIVI